MPQRLSGGISVLFLLRAFFNIITVSREYGEYKTESVGEICTTTRNNVNSVCAMSGGGQYTELISAAMISQGICRDLVKSTVSGSGLGWSLQSSTSYSLNITRYIQSVNADDLLQKAAVLRILDVLDSTRSFTSSLLSMTLPMQYSELENILYNRTRGIASYSLKSHKGDKASLGVCCDDECFVRQPYGNWSRLRNPRVKSWVCGDCSEARIITSKTIRNAHKNPLSTNNFQGISDGGFQDSRHGSLDSQNRSPWCILRKNGMLSSVWQCPVFHKYSISPNVTHAFTW